jgi:hypothetical protein
MGKNTHDMGDFTTVAKWRALMSIYGGEGRLHRLAPALPGLTEARRIYAALDVARLTFGPWDDRDWEIRCGYLRADFDRFITGQMLPVAAGRHRCRHPLLKQLVPARDEIKGDPKP